MKKNQISKPALVVTILMTMLFSCQKDPAFLPDDPGSAQSAESPSTQAHLSPAQLLAEQNFTRSIISSITTPTTPEGLHLLTNSPLPFIPFEMVDQNGAPIPPNKVLTLKSGFKITAQAYFDRLNSIEQWLNASGRTLRNNQPQVASETVTESQYLDEMISKQPISIGGLLSNQSLDNFMTPVKKVENESVKPMEKIDLKYSKGWTFGKKGTFQSFINAELIRQATKSDLNVTGIANIGGSILNNSVSVLKAKAVFVAPMRAERKTTTKITVNIAGITVLNLNKSYAKKTILNSDKSVQVNKSFGINVPIFWGFNFEGKIGILGRAGFKYGGTLDKGYVNVKITPYCTIKGNIEAGVNFLNVIGGGVGSELVFLDGKLELRGSMYVTSQDAHQIALGSSYYFGFDLVILRGSLSCYMESCIPWVHCFRPVQHNFFSWKGYTKKGTLYKGSKVYAVAN